jgi:hypothetical protein
LWSASQRRNGEVTAGAGRWSSAEAPTASIEVAKAWSKVSNPWETPNSEAST